MKGIALGCLKFVLWAGGASMVLLFLIVLLDRPEHSYPSEFNQKDWLAAGVLLRKNVTNVDDVSRQAMAEDVMAHYLKPGMTRAQVVALLGPPEWAGIEWVLPDGVQEPDSLNEELHPSNPATHQRNLDSFNKWFDQHRRADTIMHYQVGWDMIDLSSMHVKLDGKDRVKGYWISIH